MKIKIVALGLLLGLLGSCIDDNVPPITKYSISGVAQKGPFIKGSQLEIVELSESLAQTGKTYKAELLNDFGEFEVSELELESTIVEIIADGYYYNEVSGTLSQSRLILKALSDFENRDIINVNILTHLITDRLKKHIESGDTYEYAKSKSQKELYAIFKIDTAIIKDFEDMDISKQDDENGVLVALSSIFQGKNSVAGLSKLLADFKEDFSDNGEINNAAIASELITNAQLIDTVLLRDNLVTYYNSLGINMEASAFERHIINFIDSVNVESTLDIIYPAAGDYGENLLAKETGAEIEQDVGYSLAAIFPSDIELLIRLKMNVMEGNVTWASDEPKQTNWFGLPQNGDEIEGRAVGEKADMSISFSGTGKIEVQVETFKIGVIDEYLGTSQIILLII